MQVEEAAALIGCAGTIAAILFSWIGYRQGVQNQKAVEEKSKQEEEERKKDEGEESGTLKTDMAYIKRRIDDVLLEQRDTNKALNETNKALNTLSERVTRVEESTKQAHKRIDDNTSDIRSLQKIAQYASQREEESE